jgi:steroid 5-alpha reductase family enzyme
MTLYVAGWLGVVASSWHISHFELFGLRQVWLYYRDLPNEPLPFITPGAYRFVRHPLYVGWLLVFWSAPTMTASHLLFAAGTTIYILLAIQWEERDLIAHFGETYQDYRRRVPMLLPWRWSAGSSGSDTAESKSATPNRSLSRTIKGNTDVLKTLS